MECITIINSKEKLQSLVAIDLFNDVTIDSETLILKNDYLGKIVQKIKDKDPVKYLVLCKENTKLASYLKNSIATLGNEICEASIKITFCPSEFLVGLATEIVSIHYYNESIRKTGLNENLKGQILLISNEYKQNILDFAEALFPQLSQYSNIKVSTLDFLMVNIETIYQLFSKGKLAGLFNTKSKQEVSSLMQKDILLSSKYRLIQLNTINQIKQKNKSEIRLSVIRDLIKKQLSETKSKDIVLEIKERVKGSNKEIQELIELTLIKQTASFYFQSSNDPTDLLIENFIKSATCLRDIEAISNFFIDLPISPQTQSKKNNNNQIMQRETETAQTQIKPINSTIHENSHVFSSTINQSNLAKYRFYIQNSNIISNFVKKAIIRVLSSLNISKFNLFPSSVKNLKNYTANLIKEHEFTYICNNLSIPDMPNGETNTLLEIFIDGIMIEFINIGLISVTEKTKIKYDLKKIETKRVELNII